MSTWNDNRLDELSKRTDEGFRDVKEDFKDVRQEFTNVRQEMREGFARVDSEIHRLANTLLGVGGVVTAAVLGTGILFGLR